MAGIAPQPLLLLLPPNRAKGFIPTTVYSQPKSTQNPVNQRIKDPPIRHAEPNIAVYIIIASDTYIVASFGHQTETTKLAMVQGAGAPWAQLAATMVSEKLERA